MDKLKDFIERNRKEFENTTLPDGHLERFKEKLERQNTETKQTGMRRFNQWAIPIAATIALLLCWQMPFLKDQAVPEQQYVCELHSEMQELRTYYLMEMDNIMMQIEEASRQSNDPVIPGLLQAGQNIRLSCQKFDMQILPTLPCSDEGVFVLNQQYRNSLNSLQILYNQIINTK